MIGDPRSQPVDGHDAAGKGLAVRPLEDGIDHGAAAALLLDSAEEDIFFPGPEGFLYISLVKEGEVKGSGVIHHLQLDQLQPLADAGLPRVLRRHGGHTYPLSHRGLPQSIYLPPILIVPGIVGQQVGGLGQPQLGQLFRPRLSHAG